MAAFSVTKLNTVAPGKTVERTTRSISPRLALTFVFWQRAYNTSLSQYVFWVSYGWPDTTGIASGYPAAQLSGIAVLSSS